MRRSVWQGNSTDKPARFPRCSCMPQRFVSCLQKAGGESQSHREHTNSPELPVLTFHSFQSFLLLLVNRLPLWAVQKDTERRPLYTCDKKQVYLCFCLFETHKTVKTDKRSCDISWCGWFLYLEMFLSGKLRRDSKIAKWWEALETISSQYMHLYAYSLHLFPVCMHILYYCLHILLILTKLPVLFFTLHNIVFLVRFQLSDATIIII